MGGRDTRERKAPARWPLPKFAGAHVVEHVLERPQDPLLLVHVVQPRQLDHPHHVLAVKLVVAHPGREGVPLGGLAAVDGEAVLGQLVLGGVQIGEDLGRELGEEAALDEVVVLKGGAALPVPGAG